MFIGLAIAALFVIALFVVPISRAYADTDLEFVDEWASAHAVELTDRSRPMAFWYLRNARVLRTIGVLAGLVIPSLVTVALGGTPRFPQNWVWLLVGYFAGALYAEVSLSRPRPSGRTVSLVTRDLSWYLPRRIIVAQKILLGLAILVGTAVTVTPAVVEPGDLEVDRAMALITAVVAALVMAVAMGTEQWVIRRPQPFTSADMLAADDAVRAQSAHSLAGSALGASALLLTGGFWFLAASDIQLFRWTMWVPIPIALVAAFVFVRYYTHRAWRVQRPTVAAGA